MSVTFIYGTGNPGKLWHMREMMDGTDVFIAGPGEYGLDLPDVEESGSSPLENARIKAAAYYGALKRPCFSCDSGLFIDGLADAEQPGVNVRTINGKRLSDGEMIAHYSAIAAKLGGRTRARYMNAVCLVISEDTVIEHFGDDISTKAFILTSVPHPKRMEGFPIDCLSADIETGRHYYDMALSEDKKWSITLGFRDFFRRAAETAEKLGFIDERTPERRRENQETIIIPWQ